jgi:hypothetical protein
LFKEFHLTLPSASDALYGERVSHKLGCSSSPLYQLQLYFLAPLIELCNMRVVHIGRRSPPPVPDSTLRQARYTTALALLAALRTISLVRYNGDLGPNIVDIVLSMAVFIGQHEGRPFTAHKLAQYLRMPRPTVTRKLDRMVRGGVLERQGTKYSVRDEYLDRGEAIGMMRELAQIIYSACRFLPNLDNPELDIQKKPH